MSDFLIYSIGFSAQFLFSARLLIQWFLSEKNKKVVTPSIFWILSLLGAILLFIYGFYRKDAPIMFGQTLTYFIYIRNLQLQNNWHKIGKYIRWSIIGIPPVLLFIAFLTNGIKQDFKFLSEMPWWLYSLGITAQIIFTFRFIYQWIYSERKGISTLSVGFWKISALGASLILIYALYRKDPVLTFAHLFGLMIYLRNIYIGKKSN